MEASSGNRKIDIVFVLSETEMGYEFVASRIDYVESSICEERSNPDEESQSLDCRASLAMTTTQCDKILATNPEKATENIHKKALQWGDTVFNPVNLELKFSEPRLIPASVIGEMKRDLVAKLTDAMIENHRGKRPCRDVRPYVSTETDPDAIPTNLMTCHHCIRYANGLCSKETGQKATSLFIRNGANTFRLEFDCRNCVMRVLAVTD